MDKEGYDIALVRLPRPAITKDEELYENVSPICIDWTNSEASLITFLKFTTFIALVRKYIILR